MVANAVVRARIDEDVKRDAARVMSDMGMTLADLIRITLTRVAVEKALPFEIKKPNAVTRAAMKEADERLAARQLRYANGEDLIDALDETAGKRQTRQASKKQ